MKHTGYIYKKNKTVSEAQEKVTEVWLVLIWQMKMTIKSGAMRY
jgi:hypothetical protein